MNMIEKTANFLDKVGLLFGYVGASLTFALVILTVQQVLARYLFNSSSIALQELEWHVFGTIFLFSMAWTYQKDGHVRVDVFYQYFSPRLKAIVNILGIVFFLIPICYFMMIYGWDDVMMARHYINPRPQDYWSKNWFGVDHDFYATATSIEAWLRTFLFVGEVSSDPGGLEARWISRGILPFGFAILALQGVASALSELLVLVNPHKEHVSGK